MSDLEKTPDGKLAPGANGVWNQTDPYENFMGRWSRRVAPEFIRWLGPSPALKWLDVGCGSGALSEAIAGACRPASIIAIDQSEAFVKDTQSRLGELVQCKVGDALALPVDDASVDYVVSGLVLNFIPDKHRALAEMKRVLSPGGTVGIYVWDYSGKMEFLTRFWDAAVEIDPAAIVLQERYRFTDARAEVLRELLASAGISQIESEPIEIETRFRNFDDFWNPFLGGTGPAPSYLTSLTEHQREIIRCRLEDSLPIERDGSISLHSRAWAVKGRNDHSTGS